MSKARGDTYVIEIDERDVGGGLRTVAVYYQWDDASTAWKKLEPDARAGVQHWLLRLQFGINDPAHVTVVECKDKDGQS